MQLPPTRWLCILYTALQPVPDLLFACCILLYWLVGVQYGVKEAEKLAVDVRQKGLGLFVMADWYDDKTMEKLRILDDNTHRHISPVTGGSNVPALNDLLRPFGIALGSGVLAGDWGFDRKSTRMVNGVPLIKFPSQVRVRVSGAHVAATTCPVLPANMALSHCFCRGGRPRRR